MQATTANVKYEWRPSNANFYDDGAISFLWKRHTLLCLFIGLSSLIYIAVFSESSGDLETNVKRGLGVAAGTFLMVGVTQFNDGPFTRPHPAVWRLVLATSVLYWLGLVFLLFLDEMQARQLLKYLDPTLGVPLKEITYAENCQIYDEHHPSGNPWANFMDKMDIFVIGHALGWFLKALILRSAFMCHVLSVCFEMLEYTLQFQLPNFAECWWDHWLLDVLICNALGIHLGMWACSWLSMQEYRWEGFWNIRSYSGKLKRFVRQFTPYYWTPFSWNALRDLRSWLCTLLILFLVLAIELSAFYIKDVLWIPANHRFNIYRLFIITPAAAVATRECYQYGTDPQCVRFGQQAWVFVFVVITELLLAFKFGAHLSKRGTADVRWFYLWGAGAALLVVWTLVYFIIVPACRPQRTRTESSSSDSSSDKQKTS